MTLERRVRASGSTASPCSSCTLKRALVRRVFLNMLKGMIFNLMFIITWTYIKNTVVLKLCVLNRGHFVILCTIIVVVIARNIKRLKEEGTTLALRIKGCCCC